jgi:adenosine/AMP kinase
MTDEKDKQSFFTFLTVVIGIAVLLAIFSIAVYVFKDAQNPAESIVAVMGSVTGVLGTLVGYVAGQAGKEKAENRATQAERQLTAVVGEGGKDILKQAKDAYPELFK